ncbi:MAG: hypothetical protein IT291_07510 [Deltaproteobacteria bacterium]|nr:hypothetical protein [Deltaproteobacteria bacterium]
MRHIFFVKLLTLIGNANAWTRYALALVRLFFVVHVVCLQGFFVAAQEQGDKSAVTVAQIKSEPSNYVVDQDVFLSFVPIKAFLLIEGGEVKHFPAVFIEKDLGKGSKLGRKYFQVGAILPSVIANKMGAILRFTFFFVGEQSQFAATPVVEWSMAELLSNYKGIEAVEAAVADLNSLLNLAQYQMSELEESLNEVREDASRIAGVDNIIMLKTRLAELESDEVSKQAERARLERLLAIGRGLADVPELSFYMQELSVHLQEAAKTTAMADRLSVRKRKAARAKLNYKIALAKKFGDENPVPLTKEVARLRQVRRQLEKRLGRDGDAAQADF